MPTGSGPRSDQCNKPNPDLNPYESYMRICRFFIRNIHKVDTYVPYVEIPIRIRGVHIDIDNVGFPWFPLQINRTQHQRSEHQRHTSTALYINENWLMYRHYTNKYSPQIICFTHQERKMTRRKKRKMSLISSHSDLAEGERPQREERQRKIFFCVFMRTDRSLG